MFFIGIVIALAAIFLFGELAALFILGIFAFAMIFSMFIKTKKMHNDLLSIKLKLDIQDEATKHYKERIEQKAAEERQAHVLEQDSDGNDQQYEKLDIDKEIEAELEQYSKENSEENGKQSSDESSNDSSHGTEESKKS